MFSRKKTNLEGVRLCLGIPMTTNLSNPKMSQNKPTYYYSPYYPRPHPPKQQRNHLNC